MIQSIDRAAKILALLQGSRRMGITELAAALDLPPSTVHGIVKSLQAHGLVAQQPSGNRYVLGPALLKLSSVYLDTLDVRARSMRWIRPKRRRRCCARQLLRCPSPGRSGGCCLPCPRGFSAATPRTPS